MLNYFILFAQEKGKREDEMQLSMASSLTIASLTIAYTG